MVDQAEWVRHIFDKSQGVGEVSLHEPQFATITFSEEGLA
jgi:hypothetical protein